MPANAKGVLWWIWSAIAMIVTVMIFGILAAMVVALICQGVALLKSEPITAEAERERRDELRFRR